MSAGNTPVDIQLVDEEFQEEYDAIKKNKFQRFIESEMTFIVPKADVQCFGIDTADSDKTLIPNESIAKSALFEFDVTKGGFEMTIDVWIMKMTGSMSGDDFDPKSKVYSKRRKESGNFQLPWDGSAYKICFSNKFSLLYDKTVYFSLERQYEIDPKQLMDGEQLLKATHNNLASSLNALNHLEVKGLQDRGLLEAAEKRIQFWSAIFTITVVVTSIVSTISIKQSFEATDRRTLNAQRRKSNA